MINCYYISEGGDGAQAPCCKFNKNLYFFRLYDSEKGDIKVKFADNFSDYFTPGFAYMVHIDHTRRSMDRLCLGRHDELEN